MRLTCRLQPSLREVPVGGGSSLALVESGEEEPRGLLRGSNPLPRTDDECGPKDTRIIGSKLSEPCKKLLLTLGTKLFLVELFNSEDQNEADHGTTQ